MNELSTQRPLISYKASMNTMDTTVSRCMRVWTMKRINIKRPLINCKVSMNAISRMRFWRLDNLRHSFADVPSTQSPDCPWCTWHQHDKLHRTNGQPALVQSDGTKKYYLYGKKVTAIKTILCSYENGYDN